MVSIEISRTLEKTHFRKNISYFHYLQQVCQLKIYNYLKNMIEENLIQKFRLKNIKETKNYFIKETDQNDS